MFEMIVIDTIGEQKTYAKAAKNRNINGLNLVTLVHPRGLKSLALVDQKCLSCLKPLNQ